MCGTRLTFKILPPNRYIKRMIPIIPELSDVWLLKSCMNKLKEVSHMAKIVRNIPKSPTIKTSLEN